MLSFTISSSNQTVHCQVGSHIFQPITGQLLPIVSRPPKLTARALAKVQAKSAASSSSSAGAALPSRRTTIASWAQQASSAATEDADGLMDSNEADNALLKPNGLHEWEHWLDRASEAITHGKTSARIVALEEMAQEIAQFSEAESNRIQAFARLLMLTIPYADGRTRQLALESLQHLLERSYTIQGVDGNGALISGLLRWLENEAARAEKGAAAGTKFVALSWACAMYTTWPQSHRSSESAAFTSLLASISTLLFNLLDPRRHTKQSLCRSVLTVTRRAVRSSPESIPVLVHVLTSIQAEPAYRCAPFLGLVMDVTLRLKGKQSSWTGVILSKTKDEIEEYYLRQIMDSKLVPPSHVLIAFSDYLGSEADRQRLVEAYFPPLEVSLLRAPEVGLAVLEALQSALRKDVASSAPWRVPLIPPVLSATKSANTSLRERAVRVASRLLGTTDSKSDDVEVRTKALDGLCQPIRTGKTTSPDHRASLYSILAATSAAENFSPEVVATALSALPKESNENALRALMSALSTHLPTVLALGPPLSNPQFASIVKAMQDTKSAVRKSAHAMVGSVFWAFPETAEPERSDGFTSFALGVSPGLDSAIRLLGSNPVNAPSGPLEGYVAVAVLKGRLRQWKVPKIDEFAENNGILKTLLVPGLKPSFLLWDKVYRRATSYDEGLWLLRALEAVFAADHVRLVKDQASQVLLFQPIAHLATNSESFEIRRTAVQSLRRMRCHNLDLLHSISLLGLRKWLVQLESSAITRAQPTKALSTEVENSPPDRSQQLRSLLFELAVFEDEVETDRRARLLVELAILAHHPRIAPARTGVWVDMLLRANLRPDEVIAEYSNDLMNLLLSDASTTPESVAFAESAYACATSLALINPSIIVPRIFKQIEDDLSLSHLEFIGQLEYGVWATPEGTTFVDVLSAPKGKATSSAKNSKEREIEIWENELREALARNKPQTSTLSKAERQLFERQLEKEEAIRTRMKTALGRIRRGFSLSLCLVDSGVTLVNGFLATMIDRVLAVVMTRPATLLSDAAFVTYRDLGRICSSRLGESKVALAVAVLRATDAQVVPPEFSAEPLGALVTRVLYRLRFLAEEAAFDAGTFAYAVPLVSKVVKSGGIGVDKALAELALEQITLALDFIAFHAHSCSETAFPRLAVINDILAVLAARPSLARTATTALVDVCDAIKDTASTAELAAVLNGILIEEASVRSACLQALQPLDLTDLDFPASLWVAGHDLDERNRQLAAVAWQENALDIPEHFLDPLLPLLSHSAGSIRTATGEAIAAAIAVRPSSLDDTLARLIQDYKDMAKEIVPQYDQFGMIIESSLTAEDPWRTRQAIAATLRWTAASYKSEHVQIVFDLLIDGGALGDRSQAVRSEMLETAISVIDTHATSTLQKLITRFEEYLGRPNTGDNTQDYVVESLVILFGRLARHLDPTDSRIKSIVERLVHALRTPSEVVQAAICDCLSPLVRVIAEDIPDIFDQLMSDLFGAEKYAERRGAAYGIAGIVRGRGISTLREFSVLNRLRDNAEDKKSVHARQGAVFAYEILSTVLGRLFEPYVTDILPVLLACFGDAAREVREATQDAAKAIMGKLSGHAVKLMLPSLLQGLDEKQWRAKKGAIEMMGAMAFLAPRQLSLSLPTVLPRLTEVLTDTHKQVREAANSSLLRFGEVVTTPEIKAMTTTLLDALVDPARSTPKALDVLLSTTFAHFIDSSSLALVIPILDRGLRERSADVKRKASAIVGNLATITESRDLIPYLSQLIPLLREVLVDPVPEARSTSAKSLGALVDRLGEVNFPDLVDSLMSVLKSPSSGVDQQGAAQGLAEVLQACGIDRLETLLPTILANTSNPRTYVREGHISLLIFLPVTFGDRFSPYLGRIIQPVLNGLADDSDYVRDASMRAGRMIVANHSTKAIDLLLPELETGLFDPSWRIRQSSVQLVGELLFRISGVSGKPDMDDEAEDDADEPAIGSDAARKALLDTLGRDRRDRVLSGLYIVRQDSVGVVRQAALHVWKALVSNTPRTVRDILAVLMQTIVRILASPGAEQRATAAVTLAETCRKLGEAVLGEVIAILRKAMASTERRQREGVCLALTELMANTTKSSLEAHESAVIEAVRNALVDPEPSVRAAAARAFDVAQQVIGTRSIDETIPTLLDALQQSGDTADAALAALKEVMQVRAEKIFPVLIPRLIARPITAFNARALASLVRVAGSALGRRLTHIVDALQDALSSEENELTLTSLDEALSAVLAAVEDHDSGLGSLLLHMLSLAKAESPQKRIVGCNLFARFCQVSQTDFDDFKVDWTRQLVSLLDDRSPEVVVSAWDSLDALIKTVEKEDMEGLVVPLRRTIESIGTPGVPVAGFSRPNGLKPLLPVLLQGLLAGTQEQREYAAIALGDLVERTDPAAFKPYTIQVVGPLIRVIGDRFPPPVKSAILSTLTILLNRVQQFVKPFFPQLQRTFIKSLTDQTSVSVRNRGVIALGVLMQHQPRVDPVVTELVNLAGTETAEIRESVVNGLASAILSGGQNVTQGPRAACVDLVSEAFTEHGKDSYNTAVARLFAALALHDPSSVDFLIRSFLLGELPPTSLSSLAMRELIDSAPQVLYDVDASMTVERLHKNSISGMAPNIARPAREAKELMKERSPWRQDEDLLAKLN